MERQTDGQNCYISIAHLLCWAFFDLPWQQWSLLNRFRTEQGHCSAYRRKWWLTDTDLCSRGETQTMSHIVESCPLTKLNGGLSRLHSADEDPVSWLTSYGSWHAYEKKKKIADLTHAKNSVNILVCKLLCYIVDGRSMCSLVCKWLYEANESKRGWNAEFLRDIGLADLAADDFRKIGKVKSFQLSCHL